MVYNFPFFFFSSSTSLLLPTHLPPPSCTHAQSCNPMDCSPPGFSVQGLFQARILEWVAISFSISMACNFLLDHTAPNYSEQLPVYKSFPCNFVQLIFQIPVLKFILTSFIFLFLRSDLLS